MSFQPTRRQFLSHAGAAVALAGGSVAYQDLLSQKANAATQDDEPIRIGCVGVGGRGLGISNWAAPMGKIVAVCDADLAKAEAAKRRFGEDVDIYQDYRHVLDRDDVDVIIQATPDHWHTKINVEACQAGKDVYGEKPLSLTIDEGKLLRKVVQETGAVFQTGTMQRSDARFQLAVEMVRNGRLGKIKQVRVALPYYSTKGGPFGEEPVPEKLDWELYQGQAPVHPYTPYRTHSIFRWWYEYAGGIITDWGNHHMDIAQWGLDCDLTGPSTIDARGLFPNGGAEGCFNTPDRFFSCMQYPNDVEVLFFAALSDQRIYGAVEPNVESSPEELEWLFGEHDSDEIREARTGIMFIGEEGRILVNRGGVYGAPVEELADNPLPENRWKVAQSGDHMQNFFECVRTREKPVAPVEVEHRTVTTCHLTNLSLRLDRKLTWDPVAEQIVGDDEANAMLSREQREGYEIS
jgi:myo-inositol 2-dehydrogenase / D-chiro-inositol 1-dehydrogenase